MEKQYAVMVEGKQAPSKTYGSYEEALEIAKKMAIRERSTAWVLMAVAKLELNDVKITSLA